MMTTPAAPGRRPCIGVIGGMGPAATCDVFGKLISATPAQRDEEHLRILVDCDPGIPSPTKYLLGQGPCPRTPLMTSARRLHEQGADVLVMACNTAHAFYRDVATAVDVPVVHMMRATVRWISGHHPDARRVGVLASTSALRAGLYQQPLSESGFVAVLPSPVQQTQVMNAIMEPDGIKSGRRKQPRRLLTQVCGQLREGGCDVLIAGCTEIPLALRPFHVDIPLVDATQVVAIDAIRLAIGASSPEALSVPGG